MSVDLIIIAGSPASGKTTIAEKLRDKLQSPYIDFGWLREWHLDREWKKASASEEQMAFENLVFVLKNYIKNGYSNVILTDLREDKVEKLQIELKNHKVITISLFVNNEEELKHRIETRTTSGFKDLEQASKWNKELRERIARPNEYKLDNTHNEPEKTLQDILTIINTKF